MTIRVNDPAFSWLPGEKSVTIRDDDEKTGTSIHPWRRYDGRLGWNNRVAISVGTMKKNGTSKYDDDDERDSFSIDVVEYDDFIEAILEVFPELTRKEDE